MERFDVGDLVYWVVRNPSDSDFVRGEIARIGEGPFRVRLPCSRPLYGQWLELEWLDGNLVACRFDSGKPILFSSWWFSHRETPIPR